MKLSPEDLAMLSPEEQELAKQMEAASENGQDLTLDPDEQPAAKPPAPAPAPAQGQADTGTNAEGTETAAAPAAAPAQAPTAPPAASTEQQEAAQRTPEQPTTYQVGDIKPLQDARTVLRTQLADLDEKWSDGDIEQADYKRQKLELQTQIDDLTGQMAVAQTLQAANQQSIEAAQKATLAVIRASGARAGVDYSTPVVAAQFNAALEALDADPANAQLTFEELAEMAHHTVMALRGKAVPAPAPAPAPAEAPTPAPAPAASRTPPTPPVTLRNMPAAQQPNTDHGTGTVTDQVLSGNALEMEAAWDRLTPAQRQQVLAGKI